MKDENELAAIVVKTAIEIHRNLGPGLFESVFKRILAHELRTTHELDVETEVSIPIEWGTLIIDNAFKCDMVINKKLLIEMKCVEFLSPLHHRQLLTYLKLTGMKLGLLINFDSVLLKDGIKRVVNNL